MNYFCVNTDNTEDVEHQKRMEERRTVALYALKEPADKEVWEKEIEKLQIGDIIFLYQNKCGIVAMGKVAGPTNEPEILDTGYVEYSKPLDEFIPLFKTPITIVEIKDLLEKQISRKAMTQLSSEDGECLKNHIQASRKVYV